MSKLDALRYRERNILSWLREVPTWDIQADGKYTVATKQTALEEAKAELETVQAEIKKELGL